LKYIARFIFWIIGWKIDPNPPENIKKCVIAVGPHTSNWDFILGRLAFFQYGVQGKFLIKKELFFFP
jgi:1-acyl-sn-glycerol-3-phosphate acyltransferase